MCEGTHIWGSSLLLLMGVGQEQIEVSGQSLLVLPNETVPETSYLGQKTLATNFPCSMCEWRVRCRCSSSRAWNSSQALYGSCMHMDNLSTWIAHMWLQLLCIKTCCTKCRVCHIFKHLQLGAQQIKYKCYKCVCIDTCIQAPLHAPAFMQSQKQMPITHVGVHQPNSGLLNHDHEQSEHSSGCLWCPYLPP